jgi:O-acetylhomoserine/O-acetylserine sulfhydrylase-like pyridoxal-dependent enzyme
MKNFLKIVLFIDLAIFILAGICSWLITDLKFGAVLIWTGLGSIVIGSFAALGGWSVAPGEYNLKFNQKLPQLNYERTPDKWSEMNKSYSFCLYMAAAAIIPIIIGVLIDQYLQ